MHARKKLDLDRADLMAALAYAAAPGDRGRVLEDLEYLWRPRHTLVTLSVRSVFDLLLDEQDWPRGSEVLMSAWTIPHMIELVRAHGLVPVPIDLDLSTLEPRLDQIRERITGRTVAVVATHLFGTRMDLMPIARIAREHDLFVIEDCAQAFDASGYLGHPDADVSMFSFGSIKSCTALGGAMTTVRSSSLCERLRDRHRQWPVAPRGEWIGKVLKYRALHAISGAETFGVLVGTARLLGADYDRLICRAARGFPGPAWRERIRRRPSLPLLLFLRRRLTCVDAHRYRARAERGDALVDLLPDSASVPGAAAGYRTWWLLGVLADRPSVLVEACRRAGFDASSHSSSLTVVDPPLDRLELDPAEARWGLQRLVYLPVHDGVPAGELHRLAGVYCSYVGLATTSRTETRSARPVSSRYSRSSLTA